MRAFRPAPTELAPAVFLPAEARAAYFRAGARITASRTSAIAAGLTAAAAGDPRHLGRKKRASPEGERSARRAEMPVRPLRSGALDRRVARARTGG